MPGSAYFAKNIDLHLGVDRGSRDAAMAEIVADRHHRQALIEEMLGGGMTQRMRTTTFSSDPETIKACTDDPLYHMSVERLDRSLQRQE